MSKASSQTAEAGHAGLRLRPLLHVAGTVEEAQKVLEEQISLEHTDIEALGVEARYWTWKTAVRKLVAQSWFAETLTLHEQHLASSDSRGSQRASQKGALCVNC